MTPGPVAEDPDPAPEAHLPHLGVAAVFHLTSDPAVTVTVALSGISDVLQAGALRACVGPTGPGTSLSIQSPCRLHSGRKSYDMARPSEIQGPFLAIRCRGEVPEMQSVVFGRASS